MSFADFHWIAVHSDKTVEKPNYADINRETLQSFTVYKIKKGEELKTFKRPDGLTGPFKIACRLRSTGPVNVVEDDNGVLRSKLVPNKRVIIVYDGSNYTIIDDDYSISVTDDLTKLQRKPFPFSPNIGEVE